MGDVAAREDVIETRIKIYNGVAVLTDLATACASFVAAVTLASAMPFITGTDGLIYLNLRSFATLAVSLAFISGLHVVFSVFYYTLQNPFGVRSIIRLAPRVAGLALADCAIISLSVVALKSAPLPQEFYLGFAAMLVCATLIMRLVMQGLLSWHFASKDNLINILIVGTNRRAYDFYRYIESNRFLGYRVVGFLDDFNYSGIEEMHILAPLMEFERVARDNILDTVVVFLPVRSYYDQVIAIVEAARTQGIPVQHMYSVFDHRRVKMSPTSIGSHAGMSIESGPSNPWLLGLKRVFDVAFSAAVIIMISPVLIAAAIAIKLDSKGPVFFTQQRVGYHKRRIGVFKLRTMVADAEKRMADLEALNEMDGPVFKIKDDPRVTRVGKFLRRFNIDELPQFFNVLIGDMSVVGPRPMAERDYQGFSEDWLRKRFSMRPGITCTWQVQPSRNSIPFEEWMAMDMEYIDNWSFGRDLVIILKTVTATMRGTGQ
jgi:exopolysaccharide biosynthesis polyprenyl glycosylphosphotransferase